MTDLAFQVPLAMLCALVGVVAMLAWFFLSMRRAGCSSRQIATLMGLRCLLLLGLVLLVGRPVWKSPDEEGQQRERIALLIDRSQSMGIREGNQTRYQQAVAFARDTLIPVVDQSKLQIQPMLFAGDVREVTGREVASAAPDGTATNLGRAIVQSVLASQPPPLLAIALTDGIVTTPSDHSRAVTALVTNAVPVLAVGFGSESGGQVIRLDAIDAPPIAEPGQRFRVTARLQATGETIPPFELLLLRDGQFVERRRIEPSTGPRTWLENFEVASQDEGIHTYTVRLMLAANESMTATRTEDSALVRISSSDEMRVLYVQGGLTWDYKFVNIALRSDPSIRLSGLSRTASTSKFFENVQSDVELPGGFPNSLEKLGEFRVVVLSNLRPGDLTPKQQQLLADFCGQLGGGLLMIGGPQTFNASWRDSRLEELLPVRFAVLSNLAVSQPFRLRLTDQAKDHPVFQISDQVAPQQAWADLPTFSNRAVVEDIKPGAEVWLESAGGVGRPVLMASQRYGNGLASVICMQNLWRWRLARESQPEQFDRFWRQLFRYLAEAGRESVSLVLSDPQPTVGREIELVLERRSAAGSNKPSSRRVRLRIQDPEQNEVMDLPIDIPADRQAEIRFTPDKVGMHTITVLEDADRILVTRELDVRDQANELASTARNMETLRQFAGISGGIALEAETREDVSSLLKSYLEPDEPPKVRIDYAQPIGVNGWMMGLLLACLSAEWLLRKRWGLI